MTPNPGSDEALDLGCACPVLDNAHGKGFPWGGNEKDPSFWISASCDIHGKGLRPMAKKGKKDKKDKRTGY